MHTFIAPGKIKKLTVDIVIVRVICYDLNFIPNGYDMNGSCVFSVQRFY